jgi:hypothetical protein
MPVNMRAAPTTHLVLLGDRTHSEGDTNNADLIFSVVRHKSPSVGEIGEHLTTTSICTKDDVSSILLKRGKTKKREREREREREKRNKRKRKNERETKKKRKKREEKRKKGGIYL